MDMILEFIFELYLELMMLVVPEEKTTPRRSRILAGVMAAAALMAVLALALWGVFLLLDRGSMWGILPLAAAGILSLVQIALGLVLTSRHH